MTSEIHTMPPSWLSLAGGVVAGIQVFSWLATILAFVATVLLVPFLVPGGVFRFVAAGLFVAVLVGCAGWLAFRVGRWFRAYLTRSAPWVVTLWVLSLLLLTLFGPTPFLYSVTG
jgi:hypothetical protein